MNLDELRRRIPVEDRAAYDAAYAEATVVGRLGDAVHRLREAAGLSEDGLAQKMGTEREEVVRAEEGDPAVTVAFLVGLARALDVPLTLGIGGEVVHSGRDLEAGG